MKIFYILAFALILAFSHTVSAYDTSLNVPTAHFEKFLIEEKDIQEQSEYLGELDGYPHIYEFTVVDETAFSLKLAQLPDSDVAFSSIIIKDNLNDKAVKEIGRLKGSELDWQVGTYKELGLKLKETEALQADLAPGTYRIEVSSPDNSGKYMLILGENNSSTGYLKDLSHIYQIQNFFGKTAFQMFKSSYVYFPVGILILLVLITLTWKYRNKILIKKS